MSVQTLIQGRNLTEKSIIHFESILEHASDKPFTCPDPLDSTGNIFREIQVFKQKTNIFLIECCFVLFSDIFQFVFTSGTTGLPKPSIIRHDRIIAACLGFFKLAKMTESDIIYNSLPIYHGFGGFMGMGMGLLYGTTVVMKRRFSASNFWKDCIQKNCTVSNFSLASMFT